MNDQQQDAHPRGGAHHAPQPDGGQAVFRMSHESMKEATANGTAKAIGATDSWARLHQGTWCTSHGDGWVRADPATAEALARYCAKMNHADSAAGEAGAHPTCSLKRCRCQL